MVLQQSISKILEAQLKTSCPTIIRWPFKLLTVHLEPLRPIKTAIESIQGSKISAVRATTRECPCTILSRRCILGSQGSHRSKVALVEGLKGRVKALQVVKMTVDSMLLMAIKIQSYFSILASLTALKEESRRVPLSLIFSLDRGRVCSL